MRTSRQRLGSRRQLAVLGAAAGLVLTGCGSAPPAAPAAPPTGTVAVEPATAEAVQWTDSVCGALVPVVESLGNPPEFDVTTPAANRDAFAAYLAQAQAAADRALEAVTQAGAAPVNGGAEIAEEVRSDITELRDDLADARSHIEQADANDPVAIGRAVVAAGNVVGAAANSAQALSAIDGDPRLDAAYAEAESCERLRNIDFPTV
jgi:hypothetical protein